MKHQKVQSETAKGAPANPTRDASRYLIPILTYRPQPETTNRPPGNPIRDHNQRAQVKHQKVQSETTKGAPERPEVLPKRSTSKSNQRAQMKHQKVQSETSKGAPQGSEVFAKRSTSKSNQRSQTQHQKVQSETRKGAPERPEVLPKRSTSKPNQRAQMKHQKVQLETTKGAAENQQKYVFCLGISIFIFFNWPDHPASQGRRQPARAVCLPKFAAAFPASLCFGFTKRSRIISIRILSFDFGSSELTTNMRSAKIIVM